MNKRLLSFVAACSLAALIGCKKAQTEMPAPEQPQVEAPAQTEGAASATTTEQAPAQSESK